MTLRQLYLFGCLYLLLFVTVGRQTRATRRRVYALDLQSARQNRLLAWSNLDLTWVVSPDGNKEPTRCPTPTCTMSELVMLRLRWSHPDRSPRSTGDSSRRL